MILSSCLGDTMDKTPGNVSAGRTDDELQTWSHIYARLIHGDRGKNYAVTKVPATLYKNIDR